MKWIACDYMRHNETCVGKALCAKLPIEWMRFNMYHEAEKYRNIPMLIFRMQKACPVDLIERLKECIDNFEGNVKWRMFKHPFSRNENYLITISELEDLYRKCYEGQIQYNQNDYFGIENYKKYCEYAIQDIPMLAKHIAENL